MSSYIANLEESARENVDYRRALHTGPHSQLLVMSLAAGTQTGDEAHSVDQFVYFVGGTGEIEVDGVRHKAAKGIGVFIPAGTPHNMRNTAEREPLKLFVISSPAHHPPNTVHRTRRDAMRAAIDGVSH